MLIIWFHKGMMFAATYPQLVTNGYKKAISRKDIVCVCSSNEAFGRVTVEGMLSKCLVVASDSGASGEIIQDGVTGRLYRNDSVYSLTETILKAINNLHIDNGIPDAAQTFAIKYRKYN